MNILPHSIQAVVTCAFSYTGRYIARCLLVQGMGVRNLTQNLGWEGPCGRRAPTATLDFSDMDRLCRSMEGTVVLYNIYWIGFWRGQTTFEQAVENSGLLFDEAARAGVEEIVPLSFANVGRTLDCSPLGARDW